MSNAPFNQGQNEDCSVSLDFVSEIDTANITPEDKKSRAEMVVGGSYKVP